MTVTQVKITVRSIDNCDENIACISRNPSQRNTDRLKHVSLHRDVFVEVKTFPLIYTRSFRACVYVCLLACLDVGGVCVCVCVCVWYDWTNI